MPQIKRRDGGERASKAREERGSLKKYNRRRKGRKIDEFEFRYNAHTAEFEVRMSGGPSSFEETTFQVHCDEYNVSVEDATDLNAAIKEAQELVKAKMGGEWSKHIAAHFESASLGSTLAHFGGNNCNYSGFTFSYEIFYRLTQDGKFVGWAYYPEAASIRSNNSDPKSGVEEEDHYDDGFTGDPTKHLMIFDYTEELEAQLKDFLARINQLQVLLAGFMEPKKFVEMMVKMPKQNLLPAPAKKRKKK